MAKKRFFRISLRGRISLWFLSIMAILAVTLCIVIAIGQLTFREFDQLLQNNLLCHQVQEAIQGERQAFETYTREVSLDNLHSYEEACAATRRAIDALPFDYQRIGEERYARTWNIRHGYEGYAVYRDAVIQADPNGADYVEDLYRVMEMQEDLSNYALRLMQVTLEDSTQSYQSRANLFDTMPWFFLALMALALLAVLSVMHRFTVTVGRPLLALTRESRKIEENDFSGDDLPVHGDDEMGELTQAFNRMKHAMRDYITTLEEKNRMVQHIHNQQLQRMELEKHLDQIQLEMLKSQVNPHFLFNTLNMISCMARLEEAETTDRMILSLSNLFRYNLRTKAQEVYLEQELEALADYIYLQQMRFDSRVSYRSLIRVDPGKVRIPSFTLQPVVENAFVHGLSAVEEGGRIVLRVWQEGNKVVVSIADNGKGLSPEELESLQRKMRNCQKTGRGIGLGNINRRIAMMYPDGAFRIFSRPGKGTVIQFVIPQHEEEEG